MPVCAPHVLLAPSGVREDVRSPGIGFTEDSKLPCPRSSLVQSQSLSESASQRPAHRLLGYAYLPVLRTVISEAASIRGPSAQTRKTLLTELSPQPTVGFSIDLEISLLVKQHWTLTV